MRGVAVAARNPTVTAPPIRPQVSIIMPAFNAARHIDASIRSVLSQTWPSHELIIVDDASTDGTVSVIKACSDGDPRVVLLQNSSNRGVGASRNRGMQHVRGRYLMFLDADDLWEETKIEEQLAFMRRQDCIVCYADYVRFLDGKQGNIGKVIAPDRLSVQDLLVSNDIGMLTSAIDLKRLPVVPTFRAQGHEDYIFWLDVLKAISPMPACKVPASRPLAFYRVRRHSLSSSTLRSARWHWQVLVEQEPSLPSRLQLMVRYCGHALGKRLHWNSGQKKTSAS